MAALPVPFCLQCSPGYVRCAAIGPLHNCLPCRVPAAGPLHNCLPCCATCRAVAADVSDMARLLLESGADPALRLRDNGRYTSSLHLAAHHE